MKALILMLLNALLTLLGQVLQSYENKGFEIPYLLKYSAKCMIARHGSEVHLVIQNV
ncbi:MAG: hypothetical protein HOP20_07735 [Sulfuriferula sp.]|nr:hypothetical protein [Sulfuriferula sp.]